MKSCEVVAYVAATSAPTFFTISSSVSGRCVPPPTTITVSLLGTPASANSSNTYGSISAAGVGRLKSSTMIAALALPLAASRIRGVPIGLSNAAAICAELSAGASALPQT